MAKALPCVDPELVILATTRTLPEARNVYRISRPSPIDVPSELPPTPNHRHWIRHGGTSQLPVNVNVTGSPATAVPGANENEAAGRASEAAVANKSPVDVSRSASASRKDRTLVRRGRR